MSHTLTKAEKSAAVARLASQAARLARLTSSEPRLAAEKRATAEANALARAETAARAKTSRREAAELVREANLLLAAGGFDLSFKADEVTFVTPATKGANKVDNYQGKNYALTDGFERKLVAVGKTSKTTTQELDFDELELVLLNAKLGTDFAPEVDNDREESPYLEAVKLADFYNSEAGKEVLANVTAERRANTRTRLNHTSNLKHNTERAALRAARPTTTNARREAKRAELEAKRTAFQAVS